MRFKLTKKEVKRIYVSESKRYSVQRFNFLPTLLAGMNLKEIHILDIGSGWNGIGRIIELTVHNLHSKVTNYELPIYSKIAHQNLRGVPKLNPRWIVISDTTFCDSKTFCTLQKNVSRRVIPRWVFSEKEVSELMKELGYGKNLETHNFSPIWNLKGRGILKNLFNKNLVYSKET